MDRYKLDILGVRLRWNRSGQIITNGKTFVDWNPVSERIITAQVKTKYRKMTIIQCYAPY
jgi:hypothetical protein